MKIKKILVVLVMIFNGSLTFGQSENCEYYPESPYPLLSIATPYIPHASNINGEEGYSLTFSYPGFFSDYGQINFYKTTPSGSSIYFGLGSTYILLGFHFGRDLSNKSIFYLNCNLGTRYPPESDNNLIFSLGLSYLYKLTQKNNLELSIDVYQHPNRVKERMLPPTTNLHDTELARGIVLGLFFNHSFTESFMLNVGSGISYIQYKTECDDRKDDKLYEWNPDELYQKWAESLIIPLGITLSFHF